MIRWPQTIHARLTLGYAVAFFIGLIVFAAISFTSLDGALKAVIDADVGARDGLAVAIDDRAGDLT